MGIGIGPIILRGLIFLIVCIVLAQSKFKVVKNHYVWEKAQDIIDIRCSQQKLVIKKKSNQRQQLSNSDSTFRLQQGLIINF